MRGLRRADLGTDERAYPTAQNLYSLHTQIKISARHVGPLSRSCLPALLSSLTLSTRSDGGRIQSLGFDGGSEMITDEKLERLPERLERQQREREAMRQAIAAYTGPITKCPPGKSTNVQPRRRPQTGKGTTPTSGPSLP
jgi:hypothetical protein